MKKLKFNKDQKRLFSEFLNNISVAWFSAGVISPFFIKTEDIVKLFMQISGSIGISIILLILGIKNLEN